jgi:DNA-binding CsgD family transcriptional regulator
MLPRAPQVEALSVPAASQKENHRNRVKDQFLQGLINKWIAKRLRLSTIS